MKKKKDNVIKYLVIIILALISLITLGYLIKPFFYRDENQAFSQLEVIAQPTIIKEIGMTCAPSITPTSTPFPYLPPDNGEFDAAIAAGRSPYHAASEYCGKYAKHVTSYHCGIEKASRELYTFHNGEYALDNNYVYISRRSGGDTVGYYKLDFVDRKTFEYIGNDYFKDKNGVYYDSNEGYENGTKTILNVDKDTIEYLTTNGFIYLKDKNHVYADSPIRYEEQEINLKIIEGVDLSSVCVSSKENIQLEDKNNYYSYQNRELVITPKNTNQN